MGSMITQTGLLRRCCLYALTKVTSKPDIYPVCSSNEIYYLSVYIRTTGLSQT